MIAKATAISHGINALRYIADEPAHKKHLEKIHHIASYWFDAAFTASSMLEAIKFKREDRPRLKNNIIRIEISHAEEYTHQFTEADWKKLWKECAVAFDNQEILDERSGKVISPKTYIVRSKATVLLHRDSRSGIPHLHAAVCRVDEFGYQNNDHQIHLRAQRAAERIAQRHGWTTANSRHYDHVRQATQDCTEVLQSMGCWSWTDYVAMLERKNYNIQKRRDSKGNVIIKASELRGRAFMVSRLEDTWRKLHAQKNVDTKTQNTSRTSTAASTDATRTSRTQDEQTRQTTPRVVANAAQMIVPIPKPNYATLIDYTQYRAGTISYMLEHDGKEQRYDIPENGLEFFDNEFDYRETTNWQELTNLAVALFIGMTGGPATTPSGGGRSSSTDNNWGRDKDEDALRWTRRCTKAATHKLWQATKIRLQKINQ